MLSKKWNPCWWFGNENDPVDGRDESGALRHPEFPVLVLKVRGWTLLNLYVKESSPNWWRRLGWAIRNPLHNFTFFVVGMADRLDNRHPDRVFNPQSGWNIILPFVSYKGKRWEWYFGWRNRGNFGITLRRVKS
ncbi:MAG: hypothetical protein AB1553_02025 [Nitrospirota bacterium]